ncbi:MAG: hypothetical protein H6Q73_4106 [Firmicutes bacterium]|nr:hypothetical protein [Bacillota bacterium]
MTPNIYAFDSTKYAGVRSSGYGISPFPSVEQWADVIRAMAGYFPGSQAVAVWLVGEVDSVTNGMKLEFPSDGEKYELITFMEEDKHERYLNYFDSAGIKVYLQVEPGYADMNTIIDLVISRYKHHSCIIGFGVDVEWYKKSKNEEQNELVTDQVAQEWERRVKAYDNSYKLFLKHFDKSNLCPNYRGDIVFIDDSQEFEDFDAFKHEMSEFASEFFPNTVMFQIGYPKDEKWWNEYDSPPQVIGKGLGELAKQECGIIWVDFSLKEVFFNILCKHTDAAHGSELECYY